MNVDEALQNFERSLGSGRLAHGYVVTGALCGDAVSLVEKVLGLLYCSGDSKPCGECRACSMVAAHNHPDIMWIEPRKKSRLISIDQIRELSHRMVQTSFEGGWKTGVVVGADRLGQEASNAFLKTLEEPPGKSVFFLVTDSPQFLLRTIMSRCQRIAVSGDWVSLPADVKEQLLELLMDSGGDRPRRRNAIETFGRVDRLASLLKNLKKKIESEEMDKASDSSSEDNQTIDARANSRYREIRTAIMRWILLWHRDTLVALTGGDDNAVFNREHSDYIRKMAGKRTLKTVLRNIRAVEAMNAQLERNLPEGAVLALGLSSIR